MPTTTKEEVSKPWTQFKRWWGYENGFGFAWFNLEAEDAWRLESASWRSASACMMKKEECIDSLIKWDWRSGCCTKMSLGLKILQSNDVLHWRRRRSPVKMRHFPETLTSFKTDLWKMGGKGSQKIWISNLKISSTSLCSLLPENVSGKSCAARNHGLLLISWSRVALLISLQPIVCFGTVWGKYCWGCNTYAKLMKKRHIRQKLENVTC